MIQTERQPEHEEVFSPNVAKQYADGCDFTDGRRCTSDYEIIATEAAGIFGRGGRLNGLIVEICPGPGNLSGEFLKKGARKVIGVDASPVMIGHATQKFAREIAEGKMEFKEGWAQKLPLADGVARGSANFNSFHQFGDESRALGALREMARILEPGGWGFVRDFRRNVPAHEMDRFLKKRTAKTPAIAELLRESLGAAFSTDEFMDLLKQVPGIRFSVERARNPLRLPALWQAIGNDPVPHWRDFAISQNVRIQKIK